MNDELAFPGTDDGRTVAAFDAQIKAQNAQVAAPAGYIDQTAMQWIQSHQGGYASASIYPNEVNGTVPFWLEAPAAPVARHVSEQERIALQAGVEAYVATAGGTMLDRMDAAVRAVLALRPAPAVPVEQPLVESVINAARAAMDESTEAYDADMSIKIPSHLAASLSLCLDEYDRAHGIVQGGA